MPARPARGAGGDTCAFCITLASRGWQRASKKALKGDHAEHIHANCDCEYAVRFDSRTSVAGYDPDKYLAQYNAANGDINAMRRAQYVQNKDKINAQKRAAYAAKKATSGPEDVLDEYRRTATPGKGSITYDEGYDRTRHATEIKTAQWLHDNLGGDIVLLNEANEDHVKTADYLWRERLWDLKTASSEKAVNSALRHGIKQIEENPGGIIFDFGEIKPDIEELWKIASKRLGWYNPSGKYDILILSAGELMSAKRY